jgi:flagellin
MTNGKTDVDKDATLDTVKANTLEVNGKKYVMVADLDAAKMVNKLDSSIQTFIDYDDMAAAIQKDNGFTVTNNAGVLTLFSAAGSASGGKGLTLQVGDTADAFNKVTVSVDNMSSSGLNIQGLTVTDQGIAADSITRVKSAIEKVSVNRGRLGALQNRLEHTLNNLATTTENMTNAESRIRDTDMAQEMMAFTKNNVLVQAAQSMLAQANQQPQQVLQLLR